MPFRSLGHEPPLSFPHDCEVEAAWQHKHVCITRAAARITAFVQVVFSPLALKKPPALQFLLGQAREKVRSRRRKRRKRPKFVSSFAWNFLLFPNRLDVPQACFIEVACSVAILALSLSDFASAAATPATT